MHSSEGRRAVFHPNLNPLQLFMIPILEKRVKDWSYTSAHLTLIVKAFESFTTWKVKSIRLEKTNASEQYGKVYFWYRVSTWSSASSCSIFACSSEFWALAFSMACHRSSSDLALSSSDFLWATKASSFSCMADFFSSRAKDFSFFRETTTTFSAPKAVETSSFSCFSFSDVV